MWYFSVPQFGGLSFFILKGVTRASFLSYLRNSYRLVSDNYDNALGSSCDVEYPVGKMSCFHWLVIEAIFLKSRLYGCFIAIKLEYYFF